RLRRLHSQGRPAGLQGRAALRASSGLLLRVDSDLANAVLVVATSRAGKGILDGDNKDHGGECRDHLTPRHPLRTPLANLLSRTESVRLSALPGPLSRLVWRRPIPDAGRLLRHS